MPLTIKDLLHYRPETGDFIWKVSRGNKVKVGQVAGTLHPSGYIRITVNGKKYAAHRLAWFLYYGVWPKEFLDHIDQDKSNNRISNLREANKSQNEQNTGKRKDNTSGHKGVYFHKRRRKWHARIMVQGKNAQLGYFDTAELASAAYAEAQEKYHTHRPVI